MHIRAPDTHKAAPPPSLPAERGTAPAAETTSTTIIAPAVYTCPQAAQILGISAAKCYSLAREGRIPAIFLGPRIIRIPRVRLEAYLAGGAECQ